MYFTAVLPTAKKKKKTKMKKNEDLEPQHFERLSVLLTDVETC